MNTDYYSMRDETAPKHPKKDDFKTYEIYDLETMEELSHNEQVKITKEYAESVLGQRIYGTNKVYSNDEVIVKVIFDEESYNEELAVYQNVSNKRFQEFKDYLFEKYGLENEKLNEHIFSKAWEEGHSSGLDEVEQEFIDFSDFVNDAINIATES